MPPRKIPAAIVKAKKSTASKPAKVVKAAKPSITAPSSPPGSAIPPSRVHDASYHYPLLSNDRTACDALLGWFEGVEDTRSMPWRKTWIDPRDFKGKEEELGDLLARRAYECFNKRECPTVIPYFNKWISKWPTVQDLAEANPDDVLSIWKGLGYYSRATRLHEGAKAMIAKSSGSICLIPRNVAELQQFPGIGRYTAGAISSIAFGETEPVLDGNVARVLSRQLGLYMDVKDKRNSDILWEQAGQLIKHVSGNVDMNPSAVPGQWNQALMELGSTICTPQPRCDECPIQDTCRVYGEGRTLSDKGHSPTVLDIEDACTLCEPLDTEDLATAREDDMSEGLPRASKKRKGITKQANTISHYFAVGTPKSNVETEEDEKSEDGSPIGEGKKRKTRPTAAKSKCVSAYCSLFPKKLAKKKVAEEECVVCVVELSLPDGSSKWLIEQRPAKGLLASLWQFPQSILSASQKTASFRKTAAQDLISSLQLGDVDVSNVRCVASFPPLVHVFTHLKLAMHGYHYKITAARADDVDLVCTGPVARKWVDGEAMDDETLSTGMRKCWALVAKTCTL